MIEMENLELRLEKVEERIEALRETLIQVDERLDGALDALDSIEALFLQFAGLGLGDRGRD